MRLIDADALKDWLEIVPLTGDGGVDINDLESWIAQQPTAPTWIPCSERLPEKSGLYLVATHFDRLPPVYSRYFNKRDERSFWSGHPADEIVAWMPLPEPYKGEHDERD